MSDDRSARAGRPAQASGRTDSPSWFERFLALGKSRNDASVRNDIEEALDHSGPSEEFSATERALLRNVLTLHDRRVEDAMVPRADIVSIREDARLSEVLDLFRTAGHSRLPVYGESLDDPRGMVHIRDFLAYLAGGASGGAQEGGQEATNVTPGFPAMDLGAPLSQANVLRPVLFVPPSMPAVDLLVRMQASRTHMALVIDEYGGIDGLVSMEDVVELIVGDIEDEHDLESGPMIAAAANGAFDANARTDLEEASLALGVPLIESTLADEIDTIGGLVAHLAGRIPVCGEMINGPHNLVFEVIDADPRRLKRIRIHRSAPVAGIETRPGEATRTPSPGAAAGETDDR